MSDLNGLRLTRSERIIVVALSYIFCAPLIYANGKKLVQYLGGVTAEARRQLTEEGVVRMASNVFVVDSSAKRTQVKVTPGKYLREVLEEACKSRKLNPELYTLKTQANKALDLSQPFRLSGLSAGAKLQLVQASRSPSVVNVALQIPESEGGGRLSDKFPSTTSLWKILRKYEDGVAGAAQKLNLTQRGATSNDSGAGRLLYEQPCLQIMGRDMESFTDLQKTLAQLGLNGGSALIKLSFKTSAQPLEEAMQEISRYFSGVDTVPAGVGSSAAQDARGAHAEAVNGSIPNADAENATIPAEGAAGPEPNEDMPMVDGPTAPVVENDVLASSSETPPEPSDEEPPTPSNTVNGISVYRAPSNSTPAAALAPDDPAIFEPTIAHAKAHQAALERAGRNTRLLSDKELDEQEATRQAKLATVQSVVVRVRYPDQSMIETTCYASETGAELYGKVTDTLEAAGEAFELRYVGSKGQALVLPNSASQRLVRDCGFRGKVLVTLAWGAEANEAARRGPCLKEEYRSRATELRVDLASQQAVGEAAHKEAMAQGELGEKGGKGKGKGDMEAKLKKFMGFGKK
ncbi:hypothetical protein LTR36_002199 [Oleoguttula mirabilis]|uniref:TUG ubiquitin-like domain-containing protein n=1 Tax=Oleoguttula mirabilis TaxID=1507867 RepID=A0AAV9JL61_9PEZI|nr:hypothetical protein LTR36_002199 [Oleoguttula mirabilis]